MRQLVSSIFVSALLAIPMLSFAHGGRTHVMGVVQDVDERTVVVEDTQGRATSIRLRSETEYFVGQMKATREELEAGRRVAIDVFGQRGDYSALEIRLGARQVVAANTTVEAWTCSMHPDVHSSEPGRCPECNMKLVPQKQADRPHKGNETDPPAPEVPAAGHEGHQH